MYEKVTARTLEHALSWGDQLCKLPSWTKSDANTYHSIKQEARRLKHEEYLRQQAIKTTPYLDPKVPYHLT